jgi:hypothetical protein
MVVRSRCTRPAFHAAPSHTVAGLPRWLLAPPALTLSSHVTVVMHYPLTVSCRTPPSVTLSTHPLSSHFLFFRTIYSDCRFALSTQTLTLPSRTAFCTVLSHCHFHVAFSHCLLSYCRRIFSLHTVAVHYLLTVFSRILCSRTQTCSTQSSLTLFLNTALSHTALSHTLASHCPHTHCPRKLLSFTLPCSHRCPLVFYPAGSPLLP